MLHRDPLREVTASFLAVVDKWIEASGEVFVVLRYLGMAGAKDYAFIGSPVAFRQLVESVPNGTDIVVFRDYLLALRGEVNDELISTALMLVPDGSEYLCIDLTPHTKDDLRLSGLLADSHRDLLEYLNDHQGQLIAFGAVPPFVEADNQRMISAAKGGIDGPR